LLRSSRVRPSSARTARCVTGAAATPPRLGIPGLVQQSHESLCLLNPANDDVEVERHLAE
jgi:hypothetical protein